MNYTDTKLKSLIINDITEEKLTSININENELYLTEDTSYTNEEIEEFLEKKANIGLENTEPVQSFINKSISWSIPDLPESSPFATNQITWNTAFQLPCDSLIIIGGTGTNALNLKYSLDNSNYQNIWQNSGTGAYITFAVVLPKGVYVKGTGGSGSQTLSYIPLKGAKV